MKAKILILVGAATVLLLSGCSVFNAYQSAVDKQLIASGCNPYPSQIDYSTSGINTSVMSPSRSCGEAMAREKIRSGQVREVSPVAEFLAKQCGINHYISYSNPELMGAYNCMQFPKTILIGNWKTNQIAVLTANNGQAHSWSGLLDPETLNKSRALGLFTFEEIWTNLYGMNPKDSADIKKMIKTIESGK